MTDKQTMDRCVYTVDAHGAGEGRQLAELIRDRLLCPHLSEGQSPTGAAPSSDDPSGEKA